MADFGAAIGQAYATEGAVIDLGRGVHEGALAPEAVVRLPLATMNRHGLIAGATGTGKTKTLQLITEQLSAQGVPVFVADVKGDLSGLAEPAEAGGPAEKRMGELGLPFAPTGFPVEFLSLGGIGPGVPVRATVSDFGPQLLAKVLGANETQESSLGLVFHYADTKGLPLLDLERPARAADLPGLQGRQGRAGGHRRALEGDRRRAAALARRARDRRRDRVLRRAAAGHHRPDARRARTAAGSISCLELPAVQDRPGLFSTVMMWLVAELFEQLPEAGDLDKPKLVFFLDEAHLLFADATDAFVESVDADGAADPLQGRRRVLRHPGADRPAGVGARPARQPRPARAARVHAQGREGPARGRLDLPDVGVLRRRRAADRRWARARRR